MATKSTLVTIKGKIVDITLDIAKNFKADANEPATPIEHKNEDIESFIFIDGNLKTESFTDLVKAVLEDKTATLLESGDAEVAGRTAKLFRQRDDEGFISLVLIVPYGDKGAGLLIRGMYPEKRPKLEEDIKHMLFSASISMPGAPAIEPTMSQKDIIAAHPPELKKAISQPLKVVELNLFTNPLKGFPHEIFKMKNLETLYLGDTTIKELPEEIAKLDKLKYLDISSNPIRELPAEIGQLKCLEVLDASACELTSIPDTIGDMRSLENLNLNYNRLSTLPDSIGQLKQLKSLDIVDNPFTSLPKSLGQLGSTTINVDQKAKALYSDISYKAPKPKRAIGDADLYARYDIGLVARIDLVFADNKWDAYRKALEYCALRGIGLRSLKKDGLKAIGNSRLGGFPDLPEGQPYPTRNGRLFTFLAQINLEEIAGLTAFLPQKGWLYFFVDDLESLDPIVLFSEGPKARLRLSKPAKGEPYCDVNHEDHPAFTAEFALFPSLPSLYNTDLFIFVQPEAKILQEQLRDDEALEEAYDERLKQLAAFQTMPFGNDIHCMNGYVFTQHDSPQELAARAKGGRPEDWVVLLALGHDNNTRFDFWDAGTLYFLIHRADLANRDFSKVYCGLESS